jgi:hypothetical protein
MDSLKPSTSSSFLQQTATFFSSGVNNKTLAKGAARSGFLNLLRCKGTPSYGSSEWIGPTTKASPITLVNHLGIGLIRCLSISAATDCRTLSHALYRLETRADKANLDLQDFMSVRKLAESPCTNSIHTNCSRRYHSNVILPSRQPRRPWSTG